MSLAKLVQTLPQEIYDHVFDLTFADFDEKRRIEIDMDYKPPSILHINKATRERLSRSYYRSTFYIETCMLHRWTGHLAPSDIRALQAVRVKIGNQPVHCHGIRIDDHMCSRLCCIGKTIYIWDGIFTSGLQLEVIYIEVVNVMTVCGMAVDPMWVLLSKIMSFAA